MLINVSRFRFTQLKNENFKTALNSNKFEHGPVGNRSNLEGKSWKYQLMIVLIALGLVYQSSSTIMVGILYPRKISLELKATPFS